MDESLISRVQPTSTTNVQATLGREEPTVEPSMMWIEPPLSTTRPCSPASELTNSSVEFERVRSPPSVTVRSPLNMITPQSLIIVVSLTVQSPSPRAGGSVWAKTLLDRTRANMAKVTDARVMARALRDAIIPPHPPARGVS